MTVVKIDSSLHSMINCMHAGSTHAVVHYHTALRKRLPVCVWCTSCVVYTSMTDPYIVRQVRALRENINLWRKGARSSHIAYTWIPLLYYSCINFFCLWFLWLPPLKIEPDDTETCLINKKARILIKENEEILWPPRVLHTVYCSGNSKPPPRKKIPPNGK